MKEKISPALSYGLSHTKQYKPSPIAPFLIERDSKGRFIKRHSDAYLLLRQRKLQESIGVDVIRGYLDALRSVHGSSLIPHEDLTDDELFSLIEPKQVNNLTTAHEFAKFLKSNKDGIIEKHKQVVKEHQSRTKWYEMFGNGKKDG